MKYKKLILLILCMILNTTVCYAAANLNVSFVQPSSNNGGGEGSGESGESKPVDPTKIYDLGDGYTCKYQYSIIPSTNISIDGFNQDDKSIINKIVTPNESIKSGTSIGISIKETKEVKWSFDKIEVTESESCYHWVCSSIMTPTDLIAAEGDKCESDSDYISFRENNSECEFTYKTEYHTLTSGTKFEQCKQHVENEVKAKAKNHAGTASYLAKLQDPNDGELINDETKMVSLSATGGCEEGEKSYSCTYEYLPKFVCMNKETSEVRYSETACDGGDEFTIENGEVSGVKHFHYFVPMNFSGEKFSLILANKSDAGKKDVDWCEEAVDLNDNYADFLFVEGEDLTKATGKDDAKLMIKKAGGCYVRTVISIPVVDGFYKKDSSNKLKGFNFYFRTINENDPFPNPVASYSLWYEWYEKNYEDGTYSLNTVGPNIKNSFSGRSYLIENVNATSIRAFNAGNNYLANSLDENGKSTFINGQLSFKEFDSDYYKVGCGPLNEDEYLSGGTTKNPLYQEGC